MGPILLHNIIIISCCAVDPEDYSATSAIITFNPGENSQSVLVSTVANAQVEPNEVFEGTLTLLAGSERIILGNDRAMATIEDTGGKAHQLISLCLIIHNFIHQPYTSIIIGSEIYLIVPPILTYIYRVYNAFHELI